jgi:hypothetical protein
MEWWKDANIKTKGKLESWSNGKNEDSRKRIHPTLQYSIIPVSFAHYSNIPTFHYSEF